MSITPQQNQQLLSKYGYNGAVGQGQGDAFLQSNPQYIGAYTAARQKLDSSYGGLNTPTPAPGSSMTPSGLPQADNQAIKRQVGYTGQFQDPQEWRSWASNNLDAYGKYLQQGRSSSPNFKPTVDFNPAQAGVQTYGPAIDKYIGNQMGYYGDNLIGSDYLNQGNNMQAYTQMRQIFDPGYQGQAPQQQPQPSPAPTPAAPSYTQPGLMDLPASLQALQGLSGDQQRSAIATDALYGMGADPDSQKYYLNMLQHNFIDPSGNVSSNMNLLPIESNYLQSLGLPIDNPQDFLSGVQRMYAAGQ